MKRTQTLIWILICLSFFLTGYSQSWKPLGADPNNQASFSGAYNNSIALDNFGNTYVAYKDYSSGNKISVRKFNGNKWITVGNAGFSQGVVNYTSMVVDDNGIPYVAFQDNSQWDKLTVMKFNGSSWILVGNAGFSGSVAEDISMAVDSSGTPYVAYRDYSTGTIAKATVMKFNGVNWITVGNAGFTPDGAYLNSLALDGSGVPYVAFRDRANSYKASVMKYDNSGWIVVGNAGFSGASIDDIALAINSIGEPHVIYVDYSNDVTVKKFMNNAWQNVGVPNFAAGPGIESPAIAFDQNDTPYVAYRGNINVTGRATVRKFNGTSWIIVGNEGFSAGPAHYLSLSIDSNGVPYVAYSDYFNNNKAVVQKFNGNTWKILGKYGFSNEPVSFTSSAFDKKQNLYVSYVDTGRTNRITVRRFNGSSWSSVGNPNFSAGMAKYVSLALSESDTPYVAYQDNGLNGKATVMKFDGNIWKVLGNRGFSAGEAKFTSIAIDSSGTPYVCYWDGGNSGKATVMKFIGNNWIPVGNVGFTQYQAYNTTIEIDGTNTPYLSFSDFAAGSGNKAHLMKFIGTGWVDVGSGGFSAGAAEYPSMVIDNNDNIYVAYQDFYNSSLGGKATVMKYDGSTWGLVGSANFSQGEAEYMSIALDTNDNPYVAYRDNSDSAKASVMRFNGTNWVAVGALGFSKGVITYPTLKVDKNNNPILAFTDGGAWAYKYTNACIPTADSISVTSCNSFISPSGKYAWKTSGYFLDTVSNSIGCDSILTINLSVKLIDTTIISTGKKLTANATGSVLYQWLRCDSSYNLIPGATGRSFEPITPGNYAVVINDGECTDTSGCYFTSTIGMMDESVSNFRIYPNPTKNRLIVELTENYEPCDLTLYDARGKVLLNQLVQENKTIINLTGYPEGVYILRLKINGQILTKQIIRN